MDGSIALVEFSKQFRSARRNSFNYAQIEVGLKISTRAVLLELVPQLLDGRAVAGTAAAVDGGRGVVVDGQPPEHGAQGALAAGLLLLLLEELVAVPVDEVERGDGRVPDLAQPREDLGNGA